jgi:hypothetical protein
MGRVSRQPTLRDAFRPWWEKYASEESGAWMELSGVSVFLSCSRSCFEILTQIIKEKYHKIMGICDLKCHRLKFTHVTQKCIL